MSNLSHSDNRASLIPWGSEGLWQEVNASVRHLVLKRSDELKKAKALAHLILMEMMDVFAEMDRLCAATCPSCKEPCCVVATLWYDFKDLIFLHLNDISIARAQPLNQYGDTCRYLGKKGCILKREARPWICTYYICPSQTYLFRRQNRQFYREFDGKLEAIKNKRKELEDEFVRSTIR